MKTEIVRVAPEAIDGAAIERAGAILKRGGLVAFPTETVYGLGGDALNPEASRKIYAAKGRPSDNPLIVHIADMAHLEPIVTSVPPLAEKLAEAWWPGPLTMIFGKTDLVPYETSGGLDTVAVRMPVHPVAPSAFCCHWKVLPEVPPVTSAVRVTEPVSEVTLAEEALMTGAATHSALTALLSQERLLSVTTQR